MRTREYATAAATPNHNVARRRVHATVNAANANMFAAWLDGSDGEPEQGANLRTPSST